MQREETLTRERERERKREKEREREREKEIKISMNHLIRIQQRKKETTNCKEKSPRNDKRKMENDKSNG